jgi:hypothetical protein
MTVYVVMIVDRHTDEDVEVFARRESALAFARRHVDERRTHWKYTPEPEDEMHPSDLERVGWLYYGQYSREGDCVWVMPKVVVAAY